MLGAGNSLFDLTLRFRIYFARVSARYKAGLSPQGLQLGDGTRHGLIERAIIANGDAYKPIRKGLFGLGKTLVDFLL